MVGWGKLCGGLATVAMHGTVVRASDGGRGGRVGEKIRGGEAVVVTGSGRER